MNIFIKAYDRKTGEELDICFGNEFSLTKEEVLDLLKED